MTRERRPPDLTMLPLGGARGGNKKRPNPLSQQQSSHADDDGGPGAGASAKRAKQLDTELLHMTVELPYEEPHTRAWHHAIDTYLNNLLANPGQPAQSSYISLMVLCKRQPAAFATPTVVAKLHRFLQPSEFEAADMQKALVSAYKRTSLLPVLAANLLQAALEASSEWPTELVKAYLDDAIGSRAWVDSDNCTDFVANVCSAFPGGGEPTPVVHAAAAAAVVDALQSGIEEEEEELEEELLLEEEVVEETGAVGVSQVPFLPLPVTAIPIAKVAVRYSQASQARVSAYVHQWLTHQVQGLGSHGEIPRNLIRVLTVTAGLSKSRLLSGHHLENWLNNSVLSKHAKGLLVEVARLCDGSTGRSHAGDAAGAVTLTDDESTLQSILGLRLRQANVASMHVDAVFQVVQNRDEYADAALRFYLAAEIGQRPSAQNIKLAQTVLQSVATVSARSLGLDPATVRDQRASQKLSSILLEMSLNTDQGPQLRSVLRRLLKDAAAAAAAVAAAPVVSSLVGQQGLQGSTGATMTGPIFGFKVNYVSLCSGLMFNIETLQGLRQTVSDPQQRELWVLSIIDLLCTVMFVLASTTLTVHNGGSTADSAAPGAGDGNAANNGAGAEYQMHVWIAQIQHDALQWCHALFKSGFVRFTAVANYTAGMVVSHDPSCPGIILEGVVRRLLLLDPLNTYRGVTASDAVGQPSSHDDACCQLLTGVGAYAEEESLNWFLVFSAVGMPLKSDSIVDVLMAMLSRTANGRLPRISQSHKVPPVTFKSTTLLDSVFRLAAVNVEHAISKEYGGHHKPILMHHRLFWRSNLIAVLLTALEPQVMGHLAWSNYPSARILLESLITQSYTFPPPHYCTVPSGMQSLSSSSLNQPPHNLSPEGSILIAADRDARTAEVEYVRENLKQLQTEYSHSGLLASLKCLQNMPDMPDHLSLSEYLMYHAPAGGAARCPPRWLYSQLQLMEDNLGITKALVMCRSPDMLQDIVSRQEAAQEEGGADGDAGVAVWTSWLSAAVEQDVDLVVSLPVACLCELALKYIQSQVMMSPGSGLYHVVNGPGGQVQSSQQTSQLSIQAHALNRIIAVLGEFLWATTAEAAAVDPAGMDDDGDEQEHEEVQDGVTVFRLCIGKATASARCHTRSLGRTMLQMVLLSRPPSVSVEQATISPAVLTTCSWLLEADRLPMMTGGEAATSHVKDNLIEALLYALEVETDVSVVGDYVRYLQGLASIQSEEDGGALSAQLCAAVIRVGCSRPLLTSELFIATDHFTTQPHQDRVPPPPPACETVVNILAASLTPLTGPVLESMLQQDDEQEDNEAQMGESLPLIEIKLGEAAIHLSTQVMSSILVMLSNCSVTHSRFGDVWSLLFVENDCLAALSVASVEKALSGTNVIVVQAVAKHASAAALLKILLQSWCGGLMGGGEHHLQVIIDALASKPITAVAGGDSLHGGMVDRGMLNNPGPGQRGSMRLWQELSAVLDAYMEGNAQGGNAALHLKRNMQTLLPAKKADRQSKRVTNTVKHQSSSTSAKVDVLTSPNQTACVDAGDVLHYLGVSSSAAPEPTHMASQLECLTCFAYGHSQAASACMISPEKAKVISDMVQCISDNSKDIISACTNGSRSSNASTLLLVGPLLHLLMLAYYAADRATQRQKHCELPLSWAIFRSKFAEVLPWLEPNTQITAKASASLLIASTPSTKWLHDCSSQVISNGGVHLVHLHAALAVVFRRCHLSVCTGLGESRTFAQARRTVVDVLMHVLSLQVALREDLALHTHDKSDRRDQQLRSRACVSMLLDFLLHVDGHLEDGTLRALACGAVPVSKRDPMAPFQSRGESPAYMLTFQPVLLAAYCLGHTSEARRLDAFAHLHDTSHDWCRLQPSIDRDGKTLPPLLSVSRRAFVHALCVSLCLGKSDPATTSSDQSQIDAFERDIWAANGQAVGLRGVVHVAHLVAAEINAIALHGCEQDSSVSVLLSINSPPPLSRSDMMVDLLGCICANSGVTLNNSRAINAVVAVLQAQSPSSESAHSLQTTMQSISPMVFNARDHGLGSLLPAHGLQSVTAFLHKACRMVQEGDASKGEPTAAFNLLRMMAFRSPHLIVDNALPGLLSFIGSHTGLLTTSCIWRQCVSRDNNDSLSPGVIEDMICILSDDTDQNGSINTFVSLNRYLQYALALADAVGPVLLRNVVMLHLTTTYLAVLRAICNGCAPIRVEADIVNYSGQTQPEDHHRMSPPRMTVDPNAIRFGPMVSRFVDLLVKCTTAYSTNCPPAILNGLVSIFMHPSVKAILEAATNRFPEPVPSKIVALRCAFEQMSIPLVPIHIVPVNFVAIQSCTAAVMQPSAVAVVNAELTSLIRSVGLHCTTTSLDTLFRLGPSILKLTAFDDNPSTRNLAYSCLSRYCYQAQTHWQVHECVASLSSREQAIGRSRTLLSREAIARHLMECLATEGSEDVKCSALAHIPELCPYLGDYQHGLIRALFDLGCSPALGQLIRNATILV